MAAEFEMTEFIMLTNFSDLIRTNPPPLPPPLPPSPKRLFLSSPPSHNNKVSAYTADNKKIESYLCISPLNWNESDANLKIIDNYKISLQQAKSCDQNSQQIFQYDAIFKDISLLEICGRVLPRAIDKCFGGHEVCVFSHGLSRSGKTYTMLGLDDDATNVGVMPCAIAWFFGITAPADQQQQQQQQRQRQQQLKHQQQQATHPRSPVGSRRVQSNSVDDVSNSLRPSDDDDDDDDGRRRWMVDSEGATSRVTVRAYEVHVSSLSVKNLLERRKDEKGKSEWSQGGGLVVHAAGEAAFLLDSAIANRTDDDQHFLLSISIENRNSPSQVWKEKGRLHLIDLATVPIQNLVSMSNSSTSSPRTILQSVFQSVDNHLNQRSRSEEMNLTMLLHTSIHPPNYSASIRLFTSSILQLDSPSFSPQLNTNSTSSSDTDEGCSTSSEQSIVTVIKKVPSARP